MVVAIVSLLLSITAPAFAQWLAIHRAVTSANDLLHAMAVTRIEAMNRSGRVYLAPLDDHWKNGWAIFIDRNDNRAYDGPGGPRPDDLIRRHGPLPPTIEVRNTSGSAREPFSDGLSPRRAYLMYDGAGYSRQRNGAFHFGGIALVDHTGGRTAIRTICLASYGRARVIADRATC